MSDDLRGAGLEWDRRFNAGDVAGLGQLYAEDAVSMPPGEPTVRGRASLQAEFQKFLSDNSARHETKTEDIVRQGDLAIERARYTLTFMPKAGGAQVTESGRHIECRRWIDGRWQIIWEMWNSDHPAK